MLEQLVEIIESIAGSPCAAITISLAMNVALGWGWWRREQMHSARYDVLRQEWISREKQISEMMIERDDEVTAVGREAFSILHDTAAALGSIESTLEGMEARLLSQPEEN